MNAPGMHSSGPRPKLHCGSLTTMSSPTFTGAPQFSRAARAFVSLLVEPLGLQTTASCCPFGFPAAVLPLLNGTTSRPSRSTTGSEPWSKLHLCSSSRESKRLPKEQSDDELPLISSGGDQILPPLVDIAP